jgi:hypothetical protein
VPGESILNFGGNAHRQRKRGGTMKNGKHRSTWANGQASAHSLQDLLSASVSSVWLQACLFTTQDLLDAYAVLHFRERQKVRKLANERGISIEEMMGEVTIAGLKKMGPRALEEKYGTAGLRRPVEAKTWRLIDLRLARLGWSRQHLDDFLRSSKSPVRGGTIRTLGEAHRVLLALKGLLAGAKSSTSDAATLKRAW